MDDVDVLQQAEGGLNVPAWLSVNSSKEPSHFVRNGRSWL